MANIAFLLWPAPGHITPTLRIASLLARRGHTITYASLPEHERLVRSNGFAFTPLPSRTIPGAAQSPSSTSVKARSLAEGLLEMLANGEADSLLKRLSPDLVVCDVFAFPMVLAAHRAGIRIISVSTTLYTGWDPDIPPLTSDLVPRGGQDDPYRHRAAWLGRLIAQRRKHRVKSGLHAGWMTRLARQNGYPTDAIDQRALFFPLLCADPVLVLCPRDFDFPRAVRSEAHNVEASVALDRVEDGRFPWHWLEPSKPLVYCSLGTGASRYVGGAALLANVVRALGERDLQAVVALGGVEPPVHCPPNVLLVDRAPQIALLQRAALSVTHAGLGSVKESIACGVPMVAFPFRYDQPGNAARIAFHRLGIVCSSTAGLPDLHGAFDATLGDPGYRGRLVAMRDAFLAMEQASPSIALIEGRLGAGREESRDNAPVPAA